MLDVHESADARLIDAARRHYKSECTESQALFVYLEHCAVRRDGNETRVRLADRDDATIAIYATKNPESGRPRFYTPRPRTRRR